MWHTHKNTEKENEFLRCRCKSDPVRSIGTELRFPRNEGVERPHRLSTTVHVCQLSTSGRTWSIKISAQHVGVWGQDPQIDKNGRFVLNEAWAKLDFGHGLFAQLGRQALVYDDERILGGLDWNVAGRYHDALKLGYAKNAQ